MTRYDDEYDDDPRGQHIYSPEDSDTQRLGDWQSKAVITAVVFILACIGYLVW